MTTKYRDLTILVSFGVNLLMYLSGVMYPLEEMRKKLPEYYWLIEYNPIAQTIELYRNLLLGNGEINFSAMFISLGNWYILFSIGINCF